MPYKAEYTCVVCDVKYQDDAKTVDIEDWLTVDIRRSELEEGD